RPASTQVHTLSLHDALPILKRRLDETVESCVNRVGVEVNTASPSLLAYVAGLGRTTAQRIAEHRDRRGSFRSRRELLEVPGVGRSEEHTSELQSRENLVCRL